MRAPQPHELNRLRRVVFTRDRGTCAVCGWDTVALGLALMNYLAAAAMAVLDASDDRRGWQHAELRAWLYAIGFRGRRHLWEVDHLNPQAWGKDDRLENLRTLCVPCHVEHSSKQRRVLAKTDRVSQAHERLQEILEAKGRALPAPIEVPRTPRSPFYERQKQRRRERDRQARADRKARHAARLRAASEQIIGGPEARRSEARDGGIHALELTGHGGTGEARPGGTIVRPGGLPAPAGAAGAAPAREREGAAHEGGDGAPAAERHAGRERAAAG